MLASAALVYAPLTPSGPSHQGLPARESNLVHMGAVTHAVPLVATAQLVQTLTPEEAYVPTPQAVHALALPRPYVPAGHAWHVAFRPSARYVPAPQHTLVPLAAQRA